jgi:soluble lytic murein transglycosylase
VRKTVIWALILIAAAAACIAALWPYMLRARYPLRYRELIVSAAHAAGLDPAMVAAVIYCESGFRPGVVSPAGAVGLMQVMPETALWLCELEGMEPVSGDALTDPATNIALGCAMLRRMIARYRDTDTALAAYNAGPGRVDAWLADERHTGDGRTLSDIPYPETLAYVRKVRSAYEKYSALYTWSSERP